MKHRYSFIDAEKSNHSVVRLCGVIGVARSGFYAWTRRSPSARELDNRALTNEIAQAFAESKGRYGVRRIHRAVGGFNRASLNRVRRLMSASGLQARPRRRFKATTNSAHGEPVAPNLLKRNFSADAPNRAWVADTTFLKTKTGWLYLAVIIDLFSRKVVGAALSSSNDRHLVLAALEMADGLRRPGPGLVHHSDRGSTYASRTYRRRLRSIGALASMSRTGDCWDNSVAESFFSSFKQEADLDAIANGGDSARIEVVRYNAWFNQHRLHSTLDYVSPDEYERQTSSPQQHN